MAGALLGRFMLFAPFLCGYARETKFCRESHGVTHYNEVLTGHTYKSILTSGIFGCGHVCLADPRCTSYNCQTSAVGRGICELNDGEFSSKRHLVKKQGFVFVQVKWKRRPKSCWEAWKQGARTSGYYIIQGRAECFFYEMYCDFSSEPGWAWTLIMSQSMSRRNEAFAKEPFFKKPFKNQHYPNWENYRIGMRRMWIVRAQSSHWRVTCDFPSYGVDYRDYVRVTFQNLNPMKYDVSGICRKVEYINIRGHNCTKCTAGWWQTETQFLTHLSDKDTCQFGKTLGFLDNEANFGGYWGNNVSTEFRCSSMMTSTTNHWFGCKV